MLHHTPLIATIVAGLGLAFVLGAIAQRFRISPLVGYLMAGILVGPFTPGFVADQGLANELAEIGVILLMFGVGLHFSLADLLSVRAIAIPGAIAQIAVATILGMGLGWAMGWPPGAGFVFGLALSVASTVVLLRALQERRMIDSERGRIAVGWLIVEDLAMVMALVLLPAVAGLLGGSFDPATRPEDGLATIDIAKTIGITLAKVTAFVVLMLVVGRRVIPWVLHYVAHTGSRELFRLAVLALALGVAYGAAALFGVSFALGAFFAGMILSESPLSHRAAEESLPLRDAFAVLFFVSVGMLFDPNILLRDPLPLIGTVLIIVGGKSIAAFLIVRAFGHSKGTALTISASLAQIGEFSFILAGLGVSLHILPEAGRSLILAGAILSILVNPFIFTALDRMKARAERAMAQVDAAVAAARPAHPERDEPALVATRLSDHAVIVGYGRVGSLLGEGLVEAGWPILVIEERQTVIDELRGKGREVMAGNAADGTLLGLAGLDRARRLFVAIPEAFEAGQIIARARAANPDLQIVARAHSDAEVEHLKGHGADLIIMGEREIARAMLAHALADVAPVGAARTTAPADAQAEELLPDEPSPTAPRAA
ncbi:Kef-type potassium/proton antiporter (CPA2 family) [Stella humosa]|uniref:Kef-type potassium/proton antiporter (CPA2 family) n=1 Tax=Stella humosa TaxID=94 RepID=A0A3N1KVM2_9PROT|nr:YbaL family putative K(+) efflux transporter [Stella humosa]ROP83532.1 Kef-type potassium/proton antiporter (CPA2 family) [Stella humosa]BBK33195.1 sodium:proton antiporter [Stella humosa]